MRTIRLCGGFSLEQKIKITETVGHQHYNSTLAVAHPGMFVQRYTGLPQACHHVELAHALDL